MVPRKNNHRKGAVFNTPAEQHWIDRNFIEKKNSYKKPVYKVVDKKMTENITEIYKNLLDPKYSRLYKGFEKLLKREIRITDRGNFEGYVTVDDGK
jgi:hypothetical protein